MQKTILVAEDDRDLQDLYELLLGRAYRIIRAYNGQEAVEQFEAHRPDLTLMDIKMPVLSGREAITRIRALDPDARIIAVTAYRYSEEELGVPVLRKGFEAAALRSLVKSYLP
ncbi:MAG: response regulator [bacterium]